MKKLTLLLFVLFLGFGYTYGLDIEDYGGYDMNLNMDFGSGYGLSDSFGDDLEKSLDESFLNWETNFDSMMSNFETNLQNNISNMEREINSMMNTFSEKLNEDLVSLETQVEELSSELPTKIVNTLDSRLDVLFDTLESKLGNTQKYMGVLDKLTDKINSLENSGEITNDILKNALNLIELNADIQKNLIVQKDIETLSGINVSDLAKSDLESLKGLFDGLGLSY